MMKTPTLIQPGPLRDSAFQQVSYLFRFRKRYGFSVTGRQLDVLSKATIHQGAHSAKHPDVALFQRKGSDKWVATN